MRRRTPRSPIQAERRRRRATRPARLPQPYRRLHYLANGTDALGLTEVVHILARARTIVSTQDEPDGWILLDEYVACLTYLAECLSQGRDPLEP